LSWTNTRSGTLLGLSRLPTERLRKCIAALARITRRLIEPRNRPVVVEAVRRKATDRDERGIVVPYFDAKNVVPGKVDKTGGGPDVERRID
jgi:hypothetical protein